MTEDMLLAMTQAAGQRYAMRGPEARGARVRSLGWSILVAAIRDYQRGAEELHRDAELFLYPKTRGRRNQFDWAVSVAEGLDKAWLRTVLDRRRWQWKRERGERKQVRAARRAAAR